MKGFAIFVALSLSLHAAVLWRVPEGAMEAQGATGSDTLTLTPASEDIAAMVQRWDSPPETAPQPDLQSPSLPEPPVQPSAEAAVQRQATSDLAPVMADTLPETTQTAPALRTPSPDISALSGLQMPSMSGGFFAPDIAPDTATDPRPSIPSPTLTTPDAIAPPTPDIRPHYEGSSALAAQTSPRPQTRPEGLAPPPAVAAPQPQAPRPQAPRPQAPTPQAPVPDRTAAGSGGGTSQGAAPQPAPQPTPQPAISAAQVQSAMAQWGGQIQARIARSRPRVAGTGRAVVQLRVGTNGRLQAVGLARSSGNAAVDQAAVSAVQRAGRFPRAPRVLTDASYTFSLPVSFQ